ncbi:MAG: MBL fold metallo-hydrolase [Alphaproteobacteria bacterium]|nr:MBL fold metallo-hydrolase [Alphaproteobacteria bacterium]
MRQNLPFRPLLIATALICAPAAHATEATPAPAAKPALAKAVKTQSPGYFRFAVGDYTVTALYDGYINLDQKLLHGISDEQKQAYFEQAFIDSANGVQTAVNGFLVHTGKHLVLVDAGAATAFGPTLGALSENIRAAGYDPKDVDTVLLTHLHPDHASGLLSPDGKVLFPNATVYATKAESDYWLDKKNEDIAPEGKKGMFALSQKAVEPYQKAGKFKTFTADETILDGIVSASSAGHTPGHTGYLFTSKGKDLLIWGDIVHSHSIQFQNPEVSIEFDSDSVAAIATRQRIFAETAAGKTLVAGAHLPFPGVGHVRKQEIGYVWVPVEYGPVLAPAPEVKTEKKEAAPAKP